MSTPSLYAHPFSSYCMKVLTALYENATPFEFKMLGPDQPAQQEFEKLWPMRKMPILTDGGKTYRESSIIIEYLQQAYPGKVSFIPTDPMQAIEVRFMDRFFDNYVMSPMQGIVGDYLRPAESRDPFGVGKSRKQALRAYAWLEGALAGKTWAAGGQFSLADCAAAPALFYGDWVVQIPDDCPNLRAYRQRLLQRPSFKRAVDEARPFRHFFPPGAPDRD